MLLVQNQGAIAFLSFPSKKPKRCMPKKAYRPSLEVLSSYDEISSRLYAED
jgi:hypothetical protein